MFDDVIVQFIALAILLPVVAGQSGNTGALAMAVVIRGLVLRDIRPVQWLRVSTKEIGVTATSCAAVCWWAGSSGLTVVIEVSIVALMCIAGLSGAIIPMALKSLDQETDQSSSIILTTVTNAVGFSTFSGLQRSFLIAWFEDNRNPFVSWMSGELPCDAASRRSPASHICLVA